MKSTRSEIASALVALALPAAVVTAFPFRALTFDAKAPAARNRPAAAFVTLNPEEEAAALRIAKGSWSSGADDVKHLHAELNFRELPESANECALDISDRPAAAAPVKGVWPPPFLPSQAAPAPVKIESPPPEEPKPAFSREELRKME